MPREKIKETTRIQEENLFTVDTLPEEIKTGAVYSINQANPNTYTHGMFKYPCKFIPEIPRWAMRTFLKQPEAGASKGEPGASPKPLIFDPFAGSGTTLLEANLNGFDAVGTEIDEIAKLIIRVKTARLTEDQMERMEREFTGLMEYVNTRRAKGFRPKMDNISHWFPAKTRTGLGRMKVYIDGIEDAQVRDFFSLCMVSVIKKVSYADDTSPKPYVSNKVKKIPPTLEKEFTSVYRRYRQMEQKLRETEVFGKSGILPGDALDFALPAPADLAVTSPPYINAFDYGRTMRLENLWMGTLTEETLREKKKDYVGTEKINAAQEREDLAILERSALLKSYYEQIVQTDEKRALIVKKFFEDMERNLKAVHASLRPEGKYVIVIGNSTIRKVAVESWRVIGELAEHVGFEAVQHFSYEIRNPYIRIPRQGVGGRINRDYVLVLGKERRDGTKEPNEGTVADSQKSEPASGNLPD